MMYTEELAELIAEQKKTNELLEKILMAQEKTANEIADFKNFDKKKHYVHSSIGGK